MKRVLQKSRVFKHKSWHKTLRCFSFPGDNNEGGLSPTQTIRKELSQSQKVQYLSENWLDTEQHCHWWRLGMKLIRCCRRKEIETVHELMTNVAKYNHSSKSIRNSLSIQTFPFVHSNYTHNQAGSCCFFNIVQIGLYAGSTLPKYHFLFTSVTHLVLTKHPGSTGGLKSHTV